MKRDCERRTTRLSKKAKQVYQSKPLLKAESHLMSWRSSSGVSKWANTFSRSPTRVLSSTNPWSPAWFLSMARVQPHPSYSSFPLWIRFSTSGLLRTTWSLIRTRIRSAWISSRSRAARILRVVVRVQGVPIWLSSYKVWPPGYHLQSRKEEQTFLEVPQEHSLRAWMTWKTIKNSMKTTFMCKAYSIDALFDQASTKR